MTAPPGLLRAGAPQAMRTAWVHQRVLLFITVAAVAVAIGMDVVSVAPNRLVSGVGVPLRVMASPTGDSVGLAVMGMLLLATVVPFLTPRPWLHTGVIVAAAALPCVLLGLAAGVEASTAATPAGLTRVSLGGGFWLLTLLAWLAAGDAVDRLAMPPLGRLAVLALVLAPSLTLLVSGRLDSLSLLKEYANRREVFDAAALRHVQIVLAALLPSLAIGVPLGVTAARSKRVAGPVFTALNIVQTVPSIALFALLIAPLGVLAAALPGWGLQGIGLAPAVIALTLYALLPVVHGTASGLSQVPASAIDAATGMGMTRRQIFWRVEAPLAWPVLLSGLRVTMVQLIGLAVVAALIGAGGFGALVFQGLSSSALDLVLLGVLPVVAMAMVVDAALAWAATANRAAR